MTLMDDSHATTTPTPPHPTSPLRRWWKRVAKRVLLALAGLLTLLIVVFFLLPIWISNEQGRAYVLQQLNKDLPGTVDIHRWSLSWWRGMELDGLTITLADGRKLLQCPHVQTDLTLGSLLWGNYDLGNARIPSAHISIVKYADGSTDVSRLFPLTAAGGRKNPLRSLRGAIQFTAVDLTLRSERSHSAITFSDLNAEINIASPVAPFNVHLRAVSGGPAGRPITCDAILPAISEWPVAMWRILPGLDLSASGIPTAAAADWLGLDEGWDEAIGPQIEEVRFANRGTLTRAPGWIPSLLLKGSGGKTYIDAKLLLTATQVMHQLSLPREIHLNPSDPTDASAVRDFHFEAALLVSPPVRTALARIDPLFSALERGDGPVVFRLSTLDLKDSPWRGQGAGRVEFPPVLLACRGVLQDVLAAGGPSSQHATTSKNVPLRALIPPMRVLLSDQVFYVDNLEIALQNGGRERLSAVGEVALDGRMRVDVTVVRPRGSSPNSPLGNTVVQVPVTGTLGNPIVTGP